MSVLDHFEQKVRVWDGKEFTWVSEKEAKKLVKAGTHQDTTNLSSSDLKFPGDFVVKPKRKYKTRQLKADV